MQSVVEVQGLDHGFFQFPRPTTRHIIGYIIAAVLFMVSYGMYASSLSIPDVPRVEEADVLPSLFQDPADYDFEPVQKLSLIHI